MNNSSILDKLGNIITSDGGPGDLVVTNNGDSRKIQSRSEGDRSGDYEATSPFGWKINVELTAGETVEGENVAVS